MSGFYTEADYENSRINIARISVILWGYVLIWYACGDGLFDVKKREINSEK